MQNLVSLQRKYFHIIELERELSGETLSDWSEKVLLLQRRGEGEEGSLQGRILTRTLRHCSNR